MTRALALAVALLALATAPASALPTLPLGHSGRWITDAEGRVAVLHGINMVNKIPPYAPDAAGFDDDDAAFLAREGLDAVRVGVIDTAVEPSPGVYDDGYLARIQATVDTLRRHGIASLLDFHQDLYNERFQGEGFPDWAVADDGLPAQPRLGFPGNYLAVTGLQRAFDHLLANDPAPDGVGLQDHLAAAWRHVAARFARNPGVLGYEILNEPFPGTAWAQCANPVGCPLADRRLSALDNRVTAAIRTADPQRIVFYEPFVLFNFGAGTTVSPLGDPQAGFAFHDYCLPSGATGTYDAACSATDQLVFDHAVARAKATGEALLMTEFGATDRRAILDGVMDKADRAMVPWLEWHYCGCRDPTTAGPGDTQAIVRDPARPPAGDNLRTGTLTALERPYPMAVAGTPERFAFTPSSRRFTLRYTTTRADGSGRFGIRATTQIGVSPRVYPDGYGVRVTGGAIASRPRARVLKIRVCRGARTVEVTVTPSQSPAARTGDCRAAAPRRRPVRTR